MDTITAPRPFVFVLMPFNEDFIDIYQLGIKSACEEAGAYCERVDEQVFQDSILQRIYNQIAKADFIVADMTGRNPNVFYETGYAHALGKKVILLTRDAEDIPFDLKHYPHIVYEGQITLLKKELRSRVRYLIDHPDESVLRTAQDLEFFLGEQLLRSGETLRVYGLQTDLDRGGPAWVGNATIAVHNSTSRSVSGEHYRLALVSDEIWKISVTPVDIRGNFSGPWLGSPRFHLDDAGTWQSGIIQPDKSRLFRLPSLDDLFPDEWASIDWGMAILDRSRVGIQAVLRVFTDLGRSDYPIRIEVAVVR